MITDERKVRLVAAMYNEIVSLGRIPQILIVELLLVNPGLDEGVIPPMLDKLHRSDTAELMECMYYLGEHDL